MTGYPRRRKLPELRCLRLRFPRFLHLLRLLRIRCLRPRLLRSKTYRVVPVILRLFLTHRLGGKNYSGTITEWKNL